MGRKVFCLFHFLTWQSFHHPFQYPSCLCKGKLLRKPRAGYNWKGTTFPVTSLERCSPFPEHWTPTEETKGAPQHFPDHVFCPHVGKKERGPAEAELKRSSPRWLLMRTSWKRDVYCSYRYYCYKWISGVCYNILHTCCKQRRKFIADLCKLAKICFLKKKKKTKPFREKYVWDAWNLTTNKNAWLSHVCEGEAVEGFVMYFLSYQVTRIF